MADEGRLEAPTCCLPDSAKRWSRGVLRLGLAVLVAAGCQAGTFRGEDRSEADGQPALSERLDQVKQGRLPFQDARWVVQEASRSREPKHRAALKEIAAKYSKQPSHEMVAFDALHSLWLLGEPAGFYLANVQKYKENKWAAYYSVHILSYDIDEDTMQALERLRAEITDSEVRGNLQYARRNLVLRTELAQKADARAKTDFLLRFCGMGWSPIGIETNEPTSSHRPEAVWARRELAKLSLKDPKVVKAAIAAVDISKDWGGLDLTPGYREHLRELLAAEVRFLTGKREKAPQRPRQPTMWR